MRGNSVPLEHDAIDPQSECSRNHDFRAITKRYHRGAAAGPVGGHADQQHSAHGLDARNEMLASAGAPFVNQYRDPPSISPGPAWLDAAGGFVVLLSPLLP